MTTNAKSVRLWVSHLGDDVRITLHDGIPVEVCEGGRTDEGWSSRSDVYTYDAEAGMVTLDYCDDGVDCDGRLTRSGILECPADRLASFLPCYEGAMPRPEWQEKQARQRDYAAEAAGY